MLDNKLYILNQTQTFSESSSLKLDLKIWCVERNSILLASAALRKSEDVAEIFFQEVEARLVTEVKTMIIVLHGW